MGKRILFYHSEVSFRLSSRNLLRTWLEGVVEENGFHVKQINYIFCGDREILRVNKEFLNHNYYTDIITFDYSEEEKTIESDIYISVDTVKTNSVKFNSNFASEMHRVMVHGVLHLVGYSDKTQSQQMEMRAAENNALTKLNRLRFT